MEVYLNAISHYFPKRVVNNDEIISDYLQHYEGDEPLAAEDLFRQCGVKTRYQTGEDQTAKDLGNEAANNLFSEWKIPKESIDYLLFISDALDYKGPTTACVMQNDLGLRTNIGALDVLHGCTGFVYGLNLAKALIFSGSAKRVLVVTADTPTKVVHPVDADLRAIFSDAGAAALVSNEIFEAMDIAFA